MTATITPVNAPVLVRTNPADRLHDYERALDSYLNFIDRPLHAIVFVENSDSDVASLRQVCERRGLADRVEFVSNYGQHAYSELGRPYGEMKLLDHGMAHSEKIREAGTQAVVWKITGRYIVKNLEKVIARAPRKFDLYCDMKDHPMRWMDMRLMAWTTQGYDTFFRGIADEYGAKTHEELLREIIPARANGLVLVQRFRNEPLVDGIRGYDNQNYSGGKNLLKYYLRSLGRVLAPWYWM
jgi:hypothetical protein